MSTPTVSTSLRIKTDLEEDVTRAQSTGESSLPARRGGRGAQTARVLPVRAESLATGSLADFNSSV